MTEPSAISAAKRRAAPARGERAFASRTRTAPAAQAPSACGGWSHGHAPVRQCGFTLMEVLVTLAIATLALAIIAAALPSGAVLGRRTEAVILATLAADNTAAMLEARGVHRPSFEYGYMHSRLVEGAARSAADQGTAEPAVDDFSPATDDFRPRDGDRMFDWEDALTARSDAGWPGGTKPRRNPFPRPCRGWTEAPPAFRQLFDTNRDGRTGDGADGWDYADCTDFPAGRIHAAHNRLPPGQLFDAADLSYPSHLRDVGGRPIHCALLFADVNAAADHRRWICRIAVLHTNPDARWPERGWAGSPGEPGAAASLQAARDGDAPERIAPWLDLRDAQGRVHPLANPPWPAAEAGGTPLCGPMGDDIRLPGLHRLPALVFDRQASLLAVAYPACWLADPGRGRPDRRLARGDRILTREGALSLSVGAVRDVAGQPALQLVEVFPPLTDTVLGDNDERIAGNPGAAADPVPGDDCAPHYKLRHLFFAPRPLLGPPPLIHLRTVDGGFMTDDPSR